MAEKPGMSSIKPALRQALLALIAEGGYSALTPEVCQQLLTDDAAEEFSSTASDTDTHDTTEGPCFLAGYPSTPLCGRLAETISYWLETSVCPVFKLPVMFMLSEEATLAERKKTLESAGETLKEAVSAWDTLSQEEQVSRMTKVLKILDLRGVLDLLGLRKTAGSCDVLLPSRGTLLRSFNELHTPTSKLTVGGRALSKHCHRDNSLKWWGECTGNEEAKNEHALRTVTRILDGAHWINIHTIVHDVTILEVRNEKGYGLRWLSDGSEFRGFLEPQLKDGHAVGWRH